MLSSSLLRSFCRFCGQNSTFSIVFIILDNPKWHFQYFYEEKHFKKQKNSSKMTFFAWDTVNEWTSGTWICPPIAALPNFTLDVLSSVIYNLYGFKPVIGWSRRAGKSTLKKTGERSDLVFEEWEFLFSRKNRQEMHCFCRKTSLFWIQTRFPV